MFYTQYALCIMYGIIPPLKSTPPLPAFSSMTPFSLHHRHHPYILTSYHSVFFSSIFCGGLFSSSINSGTNSSAKHSSKKRKTLLQSISSHLFPYYSLSLLHQLHILSLSCNIQNVMFYFIWRKYNRNMFIQ